MRILIVDDEAVCRALLTLNLRAHGTIDYANDGPETLACVSFALSERKPYDIILLDITMPGIDGHTVLKTLRLMELKHGIDIGRGTKVIMTTSHNDKDSVLAAFRGNADGYLLKPIDPRKLAELLTSLGLTP